MSEQAAAIEQALVETAQELLRSGLVEGMAGNLSARLPGGSVVLSPSSLGYESMTPADLVTVDLDGKVLEGKRAPTSEKALHLACLRKHPELGAVIHSHAKYATMFAITRRACSRSAGTSPQRSRWCVSSNAPPRSCEARRRSGR